MTKNDVFAVFKIQQVMQGSRGGEKWEIEATKGKSYLPAKIHFVALVSGQLAMKDIFRWQLSLKSYLL